MSYFHNQVEILHENTKVLLLFLQRVEASLEEKGESESLERNKGRRGQVFTGEKGELIFKMIKKILIISSDLSSIKFGALESSEGIKDLKEAIEGIGHFIAKKKNSPDEYASLCSVMEQSVDSIDKEKIFEIQEKLILFLQRSEKVSKLEKEKEFKVWAKNYEKEKNKNTIVDFLILFLFVFSVFIITKLLR